MMFIRYYNTRLFLNFFVYSASRTFKDVRKYGAAGEEEKQNKISLYHSTRRCRVRWLTFLLKYQWQKTNPMWNV